MAEVDQLQRRTLGDGNNRTFQVVALQARLDQLFSQHQQALAGVDQGVLEFRVDVQGLVGRDGPRGGGPNHDGGRLGQRGQAEGGGQLGLIGNREATSMVCDFLSAYSTSASASAEPQSKHQSPASGP